MLSSVHLIISAATEPTCFRCSSSHMASFRLFTSCTADPFPPRKTNGFARPTAANQTLTAGPGLEKAPVNTPIDPCETQSRDS